jgi:soluble lytic murein transglycosylase-like protein
MRLKTIIGLSINAAILLTGIVVVSNHVEANRAKWAAEELANRICSKPGRIPPQIRCAIYRHSLRPEVIAAVAYQESGFNPAICSRRDACGLMQFMQPTALEHGVDRFDIVSSIKGGEAYLGRLEKQFGNLGLALAAYNYGPGNLSRWLRDGAKLGAMPVETKNYVMKITGKPVEFWMSRPVAVASLEGHVSAMATEFR